MKSLLKKGNKASKAQTATAPADPVVVDEFADAREPMTLAQAGQEFLDRISHVLYTKGKKLGDLMAIEDQVRKFLAIEHPILQQYCEPCDPKVEAHFMRKRAAAKVGR